MRLCPLQSRLQHIYNGATLCQSRLYPPDFGFDKLLLYPLIVFLRREERMADTHTLQKRKTKDDLDELSSWLCMACIKLRRLYCVKSSIYF
jgi:hypothetical protein